MSPSAKSEFEHPKTLKFFSLQFLLRRPFGFSPHTLISFSHQNLTSLKNLLLPGLLPARLHAFNLSALLGFHLSQDFFLAFYQFMPLSIFHFFFLYFIQKITGTQQILLPTLKLRIVLNVNYTEMKD